MPAAAPIAGAAISTVGGLIGQDKAADSQKEAAEAQAKQAQAVMDLFSPGVKAGTGFATSYLGPQFAKINAGKLNRPFGMDYVNAQYNPLRAMIDEALGFQKEGIGENYNDRGLNFSTAATDALGKADRQAAQEKAKIASQLFVNAVQSNFGAGESQQNRALQGALGLLNASSGGVQSALSGQMGASQNAGNAGAMQGIGIGQAAGQIGGVVAAYPWGGQQPATQYPWGNNTGLYPLVQGTPQPQYPLVFGTPEVM